MSELEEKEIMLKVNFYCMLFKLDLLRTKFERDI